MFVFFGFFNKATAYTPGRIFTQNTSNDVVPGKEVPFGQSQSLNTTVFKPDINLILSANCNKTANMNVKKT